jgi:AcrR family transcriptional regulator
MAIPPQQELTARKRPEVGGGAMTHRRRLSQEEVRRRVMAAARELLVEGGLTVSLDHISLEEIIQHAAVPRTSVYRLWPRRDEFVMAFLRELGGAEARFGADVDEVAVATVERVIQDHLEWLYDVVGRRALLRETIREGALAVFDTVIDSSEWRTYVALIATVLSTPDPEVREEIAAALRGAEKAFIKQMAEFYEGIANVLGFQLNPDYRLDHVVTASAALIQGLALRRILSPELVTEVLMRDGPSGSEPWSIAALGLHSIIESMVVEDPSYIEPPPLHETDGFIEWLRQRYRRPSLRRKLDASQQNSE